LKLRVEAAFDAKALVVAEMQMEDVQLHQLHDIDLALEGRQRHEVSGDIDREAAPRETRSIVDRPGMANPSGTLVMDCWSVARPRRSRLVHRPLTMSE
jgi:hypothetical protein